ncbi:putative bifunctional diguanylate cyclase/phosphodiesterase [Bordetella genomosp. 13]|uniref:Diguanylate cyclase n=1 Tax=Bordetella genomosp. 13 TaxID=463040 RepID=A0A1W6ZCW4_9BORD|nr:GGDEF domain-containing protein [Bordetella genomosp. 13]ARP94980.1 hypothetical protein CAL15_11685 [Bordetella genomosp. 13]
MRCPEIPATEGARLQALAEYGLGGDRPPPGLEPVAQIAARMFGMPVAAVNFIGSDHVLFAASVGASLADPRRDLSFCAHAINQDAVMVVPDARQDERFHDNPMVTGSANVRFYAGAPLLSPSGHALGALCVMDHRPHHDFSEEDQARLRELARMAADRLELRRIEISAGQNAHPQNLGARRDEEDELRRLAHTDPLTGLANRACFYRRVEQTLAEPNSAAVLMFDLDGFKDINDTLGNAVGDALLREVGRRLQALAGPGATAARLGSDEFALLLPGMDAPDAAMALAQAAISAVAVPIIAGGHEVNVVATSCGVAVAPLQAQEALELIGDADLALARAKSLGRGQAFAFVPALRMEATARRLHGMEMHRAVNEGEFVLFYQPQVRLADGALVGAEALIRWRHPRRGLLEPAAFLPALEGGPLAATVGNWVLDEACAQAARWRGDGAPDFRMGVNLFGAQFRVGDLAEEVKRALARHGLPPQALELEITENIALDRDETVLEILRRLHDRGVSIAFDDFGTGYASLSLLKRCPLTRIKIDRSFVQGMLESERDAAVIRALLDVARTFHLDTVAEGVETRAQRDALQHAGCSEGQGYLFSRPVPAQQFAQLYGLVAAPPTARHA